MSGSGEVTICDPKQAGSRHAVTDCFYLDYPVSISETVFRKSLPLLRRGRGLEGKHAATRIELERLADAVDGRGGGDARP